MIIISIFKNKGFTIYLFVIRATKKSCNKKKKDKKMNWFKNHLIKIIFLVLLKLLDFN